VSEGSADAQPGHVSVLLHPSEMTPHVSAGQVDSGAQSRAHVSGATFS
jgi:hypothetical protein